LAKGIVVPICRHGNEEFEMTAPKGIRPSRKIFTTEDARRIAARRLPRLIFDFIEGSAGREVSASRNTVRFDEIMLQSRVMADVADRSVATRLMGRTYGLPFGIAPMGMCDLSWPGADKHLAQAAKHYDVPLCLSSAASTSIEEMYGRAGKNAWFQLYVGQSMEHSLSLVDRAEAAGYDTLVLTVDVPQVSRRIRDLRNGFQVPFSIGPKQFVDFALHPGWSLTTLINGAPSAKNFAGENGAKFDRNGSRAGADWAFLDKLRDRWKGKLVVKGVTSADDATRIRNIGADAVYVSNHGGRQLDSAPPAIDLLPRIRAAVGPDYPLIFDSGVRSGEDVVKALALGADFVMVGRPLLFALAAEAEVGLNALFSAFAGDISNTMAQLGISRTEQISGQVLFPPLDRAVKIPGPNLMITNRST
jgi:isopentenyl diphosphate isomerase/L-lactate dehydrogenase-like FMN-dependent dehydrogenase